MTVFLVQFRNAYYNSGGGGGRRSFDKSSSPAMGGGGGGGHGGDRDRDRERDRDRDRDDYQQQSPHQSRGGGADDSKPIPADLLKGIYKNKPFMTNLTTLIGLGMRVRTVMIKSYTSHIAFTRMHILRRCSRPTTSATRASS